MANDKLTDLDFSEIELRVIDRGRILDKKATFAELYGMGEVRMGLMVGRYPTGRRSQEPKMQRLPRRPNHG